MNLQMFKLNLEKAEEPEIKLPASGGSLKMQEFQKNIYFCFTDYAKAFDCLDHNKLWKILRDGDTRPPYPPPEKPVCRSEATVRTRHGTMDWFKIGKGVHQGYSLSPAYLTYMQSTSCEMPNWVKHKLESSCREKFSNFRYADDTTLMSESKEELKSLLMKVKEESEKASLKLNIQKPKIMASGLITSWQIDVETMETVTDYFPGLQNHCR